MTQGSQSLTLGLTLNAAPQLGGPSIFVTLTGCPFRNSNIPSLIFREARNSGSLCTAFSIIIWVLDFAGSLSGDRKPTSSNRENQERLY